MRGSPGNALLIDAVHPSQSALHIDPLASHFMKTLPVIQPGRYRHYKGGEYEVIGVVRHSESLEPMVLYRPIGSDSDTWVRPYEMFLESVEHEGRIRPRFERI